MSAISLAQTTQWVHYVPIATTLLSITFLITLGIRGVRRNWAPHLLWYCIGVFTYGLGTALESTITLFGNSVFLFKAWFWAGAILGGYPLGTGSLYLLAPRKWAHILTAISLTVVIIASVAVFLSPVDAAAIAAEAHRPSGKVLEWQWIRFPLTPLINTYAAIFLVGGALWSSYRWGRRNPSRAAGTALIAVGGLLPAVGGFMAKLDIVEGLYVGEFLGIIFIWIGYWLCIRVPINKAPAPGSSTEHDTDQGEPNDVETG